MHADPAGDPLARDRERPLHRDLRRHRPDQAVLQDHGPNLDCAAVLSAEQREIRDLVRTLARERIAPRAAEIDKTAEFPWDIVELFRENGIFGTLADEEYGGVGASSLATFVVDRGDLEGVRDERADRRRAGARRARVQALRQRRAEAALPAAARERRDARRVRADRARLGLRRGRDAHRGAPRRRRLRPRRLEALHHERRRRRRLRRLREDRPRGGPSRHLGLRRRGGRARVRGRPDRAEDGDQGLDDGRDLPQRLPRARREPDRRGGRGVPARDADPRPLAARDRRAGARDRAGRDRLRARVRAHARDDGRADRPPPAGRRHARRHGDEVRGRARAALPLRRADRRRRRRAAS